MSNEKLGAEQGRWCCETCGTVYAEYINGCPHCWEAGIRSGVRFVGTEQADHARGAGRETLVKEFESFAPWIIQHADICPGEDLCECGKRERVQKWREALQKLREQGADTGTTPLDLRSAGGVETTRLMSKEECERIWPATERGTTPPEGLDAASIIEAVYQDLGTTGTICMTTYARISRWRAARAATQRAPVEQGPQPPQTEGIEGMLTAAIVFAQMGEIPAQITIQRWRDALFTAAPDHAREGALR